MQFPTDAKASNVSRCYSVCLVDENDERYKLPYMVEILGHLQNSKWFKMPEILRNCFFKVAYKIT